MQDMIDQLGGYLKGVWHHKWIALIMAWIICVIGWSVVLKMPNQYSSEAKVYVDTQSLLAPLLRGLAIQTDPNRQVQLVVRTLFTRPNLENIARLADLDLKANTPEEFDAVVNRVKNNLTLNSGGRGNIYSVVYESESAAEAKAVVEATLTSLVENTLGDKRQETDSAGRFIDRQIAEYEARLTEADNRLKEFKKENYELMSAGTGFYERMEGLKQTIHNINLELREAITRRDSIRQQIKGETPSFGIMTDGLSGPRFMTESSYDHRIQNLQNTLDELRLNYTDRHPDIQSAQRMLDDLLVKQEQEIEERKQQMAALNAQGGGGVDQNPVYQELKIALAREETNVSSLAVRLDDYKGQLSQLQGKIDTIPEIEAQRKALERGYSTNLSKYNELLSRRESARISEEADITADSFQFRIIDPPRTATEPTGPNRPVFFSGVLFFALGSGVFFSFIAAQLRPVFFDTKQLRNLSGCHVLGAVTLVERPEIRAAKRKKMITFFGLLSALFAVFFILMALQLFPAANQSLLSYVPDFGAYAGELLPKLKQLGLSFMGLF